MSARAIPSAQDKLRRRRGDPGAGHQVPGVLSAPAQPAPDATVPEDICPFGREAPQGPAHALTRLLPAARLPAHSFLQIFGQRQSLMLLRYRDA